MNGNQENHSMGLIIPSSTIPGNYFTPFMPALQYPTNTTAANPHKVDQQHKGQVCMLETETGWKLTIKVNLHTLSACIIVLFTL